MNDRRIDVLSRDRLRALVQDLDAQREDLEAQRLVLSRMAKAIERGAHRLVWACVVFGLAVTVALAIGGIALHRIAAVATEQQDERHRALVSSCEARDQTSKGVLRFLQDRAPRAPRVDEQGRPYFPVIGDCEHYADTLTKARP